MRALLREPLLGFLILGALIFWWENSRTEYAPVLIDPEVINKLIEERELVLERPLTPQERAAVEQNFVDREILLREAVDLGLHFSDGRVRHRLADKMMFLLADEPAPPDADDLDAHYRKHSERYVTERRVSFEHRFYAENEAAARQALEARAMENDPQQAFFWLGNRLERMSAQDLVSTFGEDFTRTLEGMPEQEWAGPVTSIRGWHLVRVLAWHPSEPIPRGRLDERLRTEWLAERRDEARAAALDSLRGRYEIVYRTDEVRDDG